MKTILIDAWNTFVTEEGIDHDIHRILELYTNPKIIVTNATEHQRTDLRIVNMPYEVFSLNHNPEKTDPLYFETFLTKFNLNSEDIVYIEHNQLAVNSARTIGILTYHFDHLERDCQNLSDFLQKSI
jgi:FMN phosphatase YigB (HAD superfamily)